MATTNMMTAMTMSFGFFGVVTQLNLRTAWFTTNGSLIVNMIIGESPKIAFLILRRDSRIQN
jgi:hypothetical protein